MSDESVESRVRKVLVSVLGVNPDAVVGAARLGRDLAADSLDSVEIVMSLEDEFGIDIDDDVLGVIVDMRVSGVCKEVRNAKARKEQGE